METENEMETPTSYSNFNVEAEIIETEEELYEAEYDMAWDGTEVEQPNTEDETTDEIVEDEVSEDSTETEEDIQVEESEEAEEDKPSDDFAEVLKWNGKEIPVTREELIALGQKGFDSEKKWQEAALNRPIKELVDKYNFTAEQLEMFGNITSDKNAEALALLAQQSGIDLYDAEHKEYKPVVEKRNYELDDVITEINQNEEIATQMNTYVQSVPQSVKDTLTSNPNILRGLNIDAQNGVAQQIMPEVIKQLAINPNQDFVTLYQGIGQKVSKPKADTKPEATREDKKRVAVNKKTTAPKKVITDDYDATWNDDAHFDAVRRRLQGF